MSLPAFLVALMTLTATLAQADQTKANNNTALQSGGSWVSGTAPGTNDNAIWNATVSTAANCTNSLGAAVTWKDIAIANPAAPVMINGSTTLTLNNGVNMASATENLTLNCGTIAVASNQTWTVASGLMLITGSATNAGSVSAGNNFVTLAGGGTWIASGTGDNGSLGITVSAGTLKLNKASSSGAHAVGGPGLTVNSGATAQLTGTGGDQIYNGAGVTVNGTLDLDGNSETINGLNGSGTVTSTLTNGTPTLTVGGMNGGGTFTGTIQAGNGTSITLAANGSNTVQSVAGITGIGVTPYIDANAGTLILNGSNDNSGAAATVASGAILQLAKISSSGAHAVGGGGLIVNSGGLAQLTGTGGDQIYNGGNVTVNGTLDLYGNSETINGLNGSGLVTSTLTNGTPMLTVGGMNAGGTFTGTIQAGSSTSITFAANGTNSIQSVACITSTGAVPYINANAGTLILNGTNDNAFTAATVAGGAVLQLGKTSGSTVHAVGGGGLTINSGGLVQLTGTGGDQIYNGAGVTVNGGTLDLEGNSETVGTLAFTGGTLQNSSAANGILTASGTLSMNGNVTVNYPNAAAGSNVVLTYTGTRSGTGSFVAGNLPAGATVVDNTTTLTVSVVSGAGSRVPIQYGATSQLPTSFPALVVPSLNPTELVVAATTPQQYGAVADGVTDDTAAFQNAMNAVYHSGTNGGGVVWIPAGNYAFYGSLSIPMGVTLHGNWTDWTKGTGGAVGTTFKVYTTGATNGTPFITMAMGTSVRDVNFWYPNQNPTSPTAYPFTIGLANDCVVQNVVLVNSYQGILASTSVGPCKWVLSSVIGTPLSLGLWADNIADICQTEDIRFSPAVWASSGLTNAPAAGGAYAAWMMANGMGFQICRLDGLINVNTFISGYNHGLDFEQTTNGASGCSFYNAAITNCNIAVNAAVEQTAAGLEFSDCVLSGGIGINNSTTNNSTIHCSHCTIIGTNGTAVYGNGNNWSSVMAFQDCVISNTLALAGPGVFNLVNCSLSGSPQCTLSASATRAAFTGCTFSPSQNIVNNGAAGNLIINSQPAGTNAMPVFNWTNVINDYVLCQPAQAALFNAQSYGATGNGTTDDTAAIQSALTAAGSNGGGVVYLPAGNYHLTNTLTVPSGVELRGAHELRHGVWAASDGYAKGSILQPYGGQGTTSGPPVVALSASAGLRGVTINYNNQPYNVPFPPTIQGLGANIYAIGVQCPNAWNYVDLDTHTCVNHFLYMVDGWALNSWVHAGNGSSGTIVDTHGNPTYWVNNFGYGQNYLTNFNLAADFGCTNGQTYVLGNCTELFVKVFSYAEKIFMHCSSEGGVGPSVTGISAMCDGSYNSFVFDATGSCTFTDVNVEWWCAYNQFANWTASAAVISTTNFTGTARFLNVPLWGGSPQDYEVSGGDIGLELVQLPQAASGVTVNGGAFHLVNASILNGSSTPFNMTYGTNSGITGKTNEFIGSYAYSGCGVLINAPTNAYAIWNDYALNAYSVLNVGPVIVGDYYPNGQYQFQPTPALTFQAGSPNGINPSSITVQLTGTNLAGANYVTNYTSANGMTIGGSTTARTVSAPVVTNTVYVAVVTVTDASGNAVTNTLHFDTINPAYTFEAEDFDYNSGNYINNPQTDAYAGLTGTSGIDYHNNELGSGNASYRPQGLETEGNGDTPRQAYATGLQDYDVGFSDGGNWGNYTRSFPAGTYNIFMRSASPNGPTADSETMYQVTAGQGTSSQTTNLLGTFAAPNTGGWQTYAFTPLLNSGGGLVSFTGGSVETLRVLTVNGGNNINFYMLIPTGQEYPLLVQEPSSVGVPPIQLQAQVGKTSAGLVLTLGWAGTARATLPGVYYAPDLTSSAKWTLVTNTPVYANGQWTITLPVGANPAGFYRLKQ